MILFLAFLFAVIEDAPVTAFLLFVYWVTTW